MQQIAPSWEITGTWFTSDKVSVCSSFLRRKFRRGFRRKVVYDILSAPLAAQGQEWEETCRKSVYRTKHYALIAGKIIFVLWSFRTDIYASVLWSFSNDRTRSGLKKKIPESYPGVGQRKPRLHLAHQKHGLRSELWADCWGRGRCSAGRPWRCPHASGRHADWEDH